MFLRERTKESAQTEAKPNVICLGGGLKVLLSVCMFEKITEMFNNTMGMIFLFVVLIVVLCVVLLVVKIASSDDVYRDSQGNIIIINNAEREERKRQEEGEKK